MTKKGLLTKAERTALEKLLQDPAFKGKKQMRKILWMNTTKQKYKVGDCYQVTDSSIRIFGVPVVNFNGKIIEVMTYIGELSWRYILEAHVVNADGREITTRISADESEIGKKVMNNENRVNGKGKHAEAIIPDIGI